MLKRHTQDGESDFPELSWNAVEGASEYVLVCEDPDSPFDEPSLHGIYCEIPGNVTSLNASDFQTMEEGSYLLKGGFKYGKNRRERVFTGPKPLMNHGEHRCYYQLVTLKKPLTNIGPYPDKSAIIEKLQQETNVFAWGEWFGTYERKLEDLA
ncbi:phosphatidylethanolamine-binding protein [Umbelopsis sp. PMI_123]|nr:phosphatidylethanolamine-binding protein [Umbelopsis sp. PMI_123]